jgi:hypothetical protein
VIEIASVERCDERAAPNSDGKVVTTTLTIVKNEVTKSEDKVTTPGKVK